MGASVVMHERMSHSGLGLFGLGEVWTKANTLISLLASTGRLRFALLGAAEHGSTLLRRHASIADMTCAPQTSSSVPALNMVTASPTCSPMS